MNPRNKYTSKNNQDNYLDKLIKEKQLQKEKEEKEKEKRFLRCKRKEFKKLKYNVAGLILDYLNKKDLHKISIIREKHIVKYVESKDM